MFEVIEFGSKVNEPRLAALKSTENLVKMQYTVSLQ